MKVDRLVSIIMILLDKKRIGARELADMFEVSPRTIYRDMEAIGLAGIPLRSTSGAGGGFEIMEDYRLDSRVFSEADLSAILTGLTGLSSMIGGDELVNALAKIKSLVPVERARDIEFKTNRIYIDLTPWMGNRNIRTSLEIIKEALQENRILSFEYSDRFGKGSSRTAEPYQLVLKSSHWYWLGYCRKRKDFRLFKLTRLSRLRMEEETFTPRDFGKPQLDFTGLFEERRTNIKIRIHKSVRDRVLDFCAPENFFPDGEEHFLVDFPFMENDFYYNILLGFGPGCECLEPAQVRGEMKRRTGELAALYDGRGKVGTGTPLP